ncbi:MAG TPA: glycosyltransferase [Pyrinomonadaceae bacterium]|nr:glycosyltransferase [Pyrinomonadaceae bacterium]
MKKVAIVVQRCHESVVGGSESLAWNYATLLRDAYEVDVLTTTATEIAEWANVLPEGREQKDGVNIIRFPVTVGRNSYWGQLYNRLRAGFDPFAPGRQRASENSPRLKWTLALQEEFIKNQGPYSEPLLNFIRHHWHNYQSIIFVTYLYPTSYFGLHELPPQRALFAPTLHDEQPAYMPAFKHAAHRAREVLWLTEAESRVGRKLWGGLPGRVIGMSVDTKLREPEDSPIPYILYCGRVDPNKGCAELFEFYFKYKRATRSRLRLVITGTADMPIPPHPDIDFRGFVSSEEKFRLMAGASVFVVPSPNESFSIVALEAMAQQTPVLASATSEVMVDHINRSGAGALYSDYESFATALDDLLRRRRNDQSLETAGRAYVTTNYETDRIKSKLIEAVESVTLPADSSRLTRDEFRRRFESNLRACAWSEHPLYSPFTQFDQEYYLAQRDAFVHKYRCFYALSRTIRPGSIIELGTCAGSSADAYLSASPDAKYTGIDMFGANARHDDGSVWYPLDVATALLTDRGFTNWRLIQKDLRLLQSLPEPAELVVVDAAHDFYNEYEDLKLALTANPTFIFVDDADDESQAKPAIEKFLREDLKGRVEYTVPIEYLGGGLVIKLRNRL